MGADLRDVIIRPVRRDDSAGAVADAAGVAEVLNNVIAQKRYTALAGYWTAEAELAFLKSLGPRAEMFVAEVAAHDANRKARRIAGFQVVEPFASYTPTMDHVALMGTYIHADFRRQGIGSRLAKASFGFARAHGYEKAVIYVLAHNEAALAYYRSLGFEQRGVLRDQTKIDGVPYDEVFMEVRLRDG
jgi:L-amino acid N-acyltransferase YncA